jgi:hypothetical protein
MTTRSFLLSLFLLPLSAGCSNNEAYKTAQVSGVVTRDGQPLANAYVSFSPVPGQGNTNPGPGSGGKTDSSGYYTLTITGKDTKGAVVGKHKVRIDPSADTDSADDGPQGGVPIKQRSKKKPSPPKDFDMDVPAGGRNDANFDLKSK